MYSVDDIGSLGSGTLADFIKNYKYSLKAQRDSNIKQLDQARRNYHTSIMGGANRRGMMYSNWTNRDKISYDASAYMPNYAKINTAYTTGLDNLRNNAVNLWNKIQSYRENIVDYDNDVV